MFYRHLFFAKNTESLPLLFQITCLIGLSWQLFEISTEYFKYKVSCRTTVFLPEQVEDLSMGICLPVASVIDYKKIHTELQYNWTPNEFGRKGMLQILSIHEVYRYTYDADKIIYNGGYWKDAWGWESKSINLSSIMKMQKYFFSSLICYLYSIISFKPLSVQWVRGGSVVFLNFGKEISEVTAVMLFITEKNRIPFRESINAQYIFRGNSTTKVDVFRSSHYSISKKILPPPYETGCYSFSELNFTNGIECIEHCIVLKSFKKWGGISNTSLLPSNALDYKFAMVSNYTVYRAELDEMRLFCQLSCNHTSCEDTQIVTIHESDAYVGLDSFYKKKVSIQWQRQTPSIPSVTILCRPSSILTELILYMMSSVSTWTGLSMMSINPILFLRKLSKQKLTPGKSTVQRHHRREIIAMNYIDRVCRLENCVVSQSMAHDTLRQMVIQLLNNRSRSVR